MSFRPAIRHSFALPRKRITARSSLLFAALCLLLPAASGRAAQATYTINATGAKIPAGGDPNGTATGTVLLDNGDGTGATGFATINLTLTNFDGNTLTVHHIHNAATGVNGPVFIGFGSPSTIRTGNTLSGTITGLSAAAITSVLANPAGFYYDLHSVAFPGGAMRDQLADTSQSTPDFEVISVGDTDDGVCSTANCTLREAINAANANADASVITFNTTVFATAQTIQLGSSLPSINADMTVTGPGADLLTVRGGGTGAFDAFVTNNIDCHLSGMTVSNCINAINTDFSGSLTTSNCVFDGNGTGIINFCTLEANNCTFSNSGRGVQNYRTATLTDCTVSGNSIVGILSNTATGSTLSGCTLSGNLDGIYNYSGTLNASNSTFAGHAFLALNNVATANLTNCTISGNGSSIAINGGTVTVKNSIIAGNPNRNDAVTDGGGNILGGTAAAAGLETSDGANAVVLKDNGGPTKTIALVAGGLAVDAGTNALAKDAGGNDLTTDQRGTGFARISGGTVDSGAFELVDTAPPTADITDVTPDPRNTSVSGIAIVFSEAVTGFDLADLSLARNGGANLLTGAQTLTTLDNVTWTLGNLSGLTGTAGAYTLTLTAAGSGIGDGIGNALAANASDGWAVDTTSPDVTINKAVGQADPTHASPINFTVIFSEDVADFATGDVTLAGTAGATTAVVTGNGTTYNVAVSGMAANGTVLASIANGLATDATGNGNTASTSNDNSVMYTIETAQAGPNFVVNASDDDNDGTCGMAHCSLREAINAANANADNSEITFDATVFAAHETISSGSVLPNLAEDVTITGPAAGTTVDGGGFGSVFTIDANTVASLSKLTITDGNGVLGAGGGITNIGDVTVTDCTIDGNTTQFGGAGLLNIGASMTVRNCTISNNTCTANSTAAGIDNSGGTLTVINCTISGNQMTGPSSGGGIRNSSTTNLSHCTISGNSVDGTSSSGGVYNNIGATLTVNNSIIAGNTSTAVPQDVRGGFTSGGYNLIGKSDGSSGFPGTGDQVGTTAAPLDPLLGSPASNGGPTQTIALLAGSPAINAGDPAFAAPPATDQRGTGYARKQGGRIDIGAYEAALLSITQVKIAEGDTGSANAVFTVKLSSPSPQTVTANYATAPGTATADTDYTTTSGTVTFTPGQVSQTINVPVIGDTVDEDNETFTVDLSGIANASSLAPQATGTIKDDDASPTLSINDVFVDETDENAVFTVTLSAASERTVTVVAQTAAGGNPAAAAGDDYDAVTATTLTFLPGETTTTFTVPINDDTVDEGDERFAVTLAQAAGATLADNSGRGTIIDDDALPSLSVNDVTQTEGNGTTTMTFTISLSAASGKAVSVNWQTKAVGAPKANPGVDYLAVTSTKVTFAPGETTKTVSVTVNGDTLVEADEQFQVTLTAQTNATVADGTGVGTITNDDAPPIISQAPSK